MIPFVDGDTKLRARGEGDSALMGAATGNLTATIYSYIRDKKFEVAKQILSVLILDKPSSVGLRSLLAYCCYLDHDFSASAAADGEVAHRLPSRSSYRTFCAHTNMKEGALCQPLTASKALCSFKGRTALKGSTLLVPAFSNGADIHGPKYINSNLALMTPELAVLSAISQWQEKKYEDALQTFQMAHARTGFHPDIAYDIALCHYGLGEFDEALSYIALVTLDAGLALRGFPSKLHQSKQKPKSNSRFRIHTEAINLGAAIKFQKLNVGGARTMLNNLPLTVRSGADPVSWHNVALIDLEERVDRGPDFVKRVAKYSSTVPEALANVAVLYCKEGLHDRAADTLARYRSVLTKCMNEEDLDFISAVTLSRQAPDEALFRLRNISSKETLKLKKYTQTRNAGTNAVDCLNSRALCNIDVQRNEEETEGTRRSSGIRATLYRCLSALMAQAYIFWLNGKLSEAEKYGRIKSMAPEWAALCLEAPVYFQLAQQSASLAQKSSKSGIRENKAEFEKSLAYPWRLEHKKYWKAIKYYEHHVVTHGRRLLRVRPIVLANLCVAYLLENKNEQARKLLDTLQLEEEIQRRRSSGLDGPSRSPLLRTCSVKLVVGTLYCMEKAVDFGLQTVVEAVQPVEPKAFAQTWHYVKRCILTLISLLARNSCFVKDNTIKVVLNVLREARSAGNSTAQPSPKTTSYFNSGEQTMSPSEECLVLENTLLQFIS